MFTSGKRSMFSPDSITFDTTAADDTMEVYADQIHIIF